MENKKQVSQINTFAKVVGIAQDCATNFRVHPNIILKDTHYEITLFFGKRVTSFKGDHFCELSVEFDEVAKTFFVQLATHGTHYDGDDAHLIYKAFESMEKASHLIYAMFKDAGYTEVFE